MHTCTLKNATADSWCLLVHVMQERRYLWQRIIPSDQRGSVFKPEIVYLLWGEICCLLLWENRRWVVQSGAVVLSLTLTLHRLTQITHPAQLFHHLRRNLPFGETPYGLSIVGWEHVMWLLVGNTVVADKAVGNYILHRRWRDYALEKHMLAALSSLCFISLFQRIGWKTDALAGSPGLWLHLSTLLLLYPHPPLLQRSPHIFLCFHLLTQLAFSVYSVYFCCIYPSSTGLVIAGSPLFFFNILFLPLPILHPIHF